MHININRHCVDLAADGNEKTAPIKALSLIQDKIKGLIEADRGKGMEMRDEEQVLLNVSRIRLAYSPCAV